ncbi:hypothetical protein Ahy_A10g048587 [Arachis hypogaea]|uniref:Uncharacterized protein n=1 Tax=Arachis hypogaea TaxID=3818 RepID=A0A445B5G2_ARAHY|nr:hypothetical protein Ahy_A10g048587 [Arachis hypogaea]
MHIPPINVLHKLLKELAYFFDLIRNTLDTWYSVSSINQKNIGAAIGLNASALVRRTRKFIEASKAKH